MMVFEVSGVEDKAIKSRHWNTLTMVCMLRMWSLRYCTVWVLYKCVQIGSLVFVAHR